MNDNPLLLIAQRARNEAEQRRIIERALAEATPLEKAGIRRPLEPWRPGQAASHPPVVTKGVSGTTPGTDPLGALLAEGIHV